MADLVFRRLAEFGKGGELILMTVCLGDGRSSERWGGGIIFGDDEVRGRAEVGTGGEKIL